MPLQAVDAGKDYIGVHIFAMVKQQSSQSVQVLCHTTLLI